MITVRPADPNDADAAVDVLRRSITELCVADHQGDAAALAEWLANKTKPNFLAWLANKNNFCVVAEESACLLGVGVLGRKERSVLRGNHAMNPDRLRVATSRGGFF
jgi:hypothetical protein